MALTRIQQALADSLDAMGEKSRFTDALLAKKMRELSKIEGRNKAVIALDDLLAAIEAVADKGRFFSVTVTSANDLLIERAEELKEIPLESRQRRRRHEKSQVIFTSGDFDAKPKARNHGKKNVRTERVSLEGEYRLSKDFDFS